MQVDQTSAEIPHVDTTADPADSKAVDTKPDLDPKADKQ